MLKAIRKFVLQRSRDIHQGRPQIVEEDDAVDSRSEPEVAPQPTDPQLDEPSAPAVWGKVKWYNPDKRYGFVELSDGSDDAFLQTPVAANLHPYPAPIAPLLTT